MKKNLLFPKLQRHSKQTFIAVFCLISNSLFSQNPLLLKSPISGGPSRSIQKIVATKAGKTFFNTIDNNKHFSNLWGLWVTDGTQAGTTKLILNSPGYTNTNTKEATLLTPLGNDKIVFAGDNESGYGELWVSDGTESGTTPLEIFTTAFSGGAVTNIVALGNIAVYSAYANGAHSQLGITDGTPGGTTMIYDFGSDALNPNSVTYFKTIGNIVYFELTNGTTHNNEIWRTDGTTIGTYQVKDLGLDYGFASDFMAFNNSIYFVTISSTYGDYLWKSDGTNVGTEALKQISTSFNSDNLFPSYAATSTGLFFAANNSINGKELWKTDGTAGGTGMVLDQYVGSVGSNPNNLTVLNNKLYYTDNSSYAGIGDELNQYDGSLFIAKDIFPGTTGSNISNINVQNNTLLFSAASSAATGNELWVADGLTHVVEIANINPGPNLSSNPSLITVSGNSVYFAASFDANGDGIDDPCLYKYTAPEKIWTGNISSDGSNIDNWFPQGVPANSDNVLLPVNAVNPIANPYFFCNDFINNGTTVNVGTGLCLFTGNFYNSGTINNVGGAGVFGMTGNTTSYHTFGSPGIFNGQFTISNNVNMHLTANSKINALRVEGGDSIYLEDYNFIIDNYPLYIPKIFANGNGSLYMPVGTAPVTFPLTNPVTIVNNGTYDYFGVNVKNGVLSNGVSGDSVTTQVVNKTWDISELTPGGSNVDITLQWNATDELTGFDRSHVYLNHYTSGAWDPGTAGAASGLGPFTFSRNGITSFSPFSISSSASALPVTLISFIAKKNNNSVQLNWQTATEINTSFYAIERCNDGNNFTAIGQVNSDGSSSSIKNYSYTDQQPLTGINYYRLKMVDADGKFTYSKIVAIKMDSKNSSLQIFPNPAKNMLNVQISGANENATLQIIDMTGRKIKDEKISLNGTTSFPVDISNLPKGTYNLWLKGNSINENQKFVKE